MNSHCVKSEYQSACNCVLPMPGTFHALTPLLQRELLYTFCPSQPLLPGSLYRQQSLQQEVLLVPFLLLVLFGLPLHAAHPFIANKDKWISFLPLQGGLGLVENCQMLFQFSIWPRLLTANSLLSLSQHEAWRSCHFWQSKQSYFLSLELCFWKHVVKNRLYLYQKIYQERGALDF